MSFGQNVMVNSMFHSRQEKTLAKLPVNWKDLNSLNDLQKWKFLLQLTAPRKTINHIIWPIFKLDSSIESDLQSDHEIIKVDLQG